MAKNSAKKCTFLNTVVVKVAEERGRREFAQQNNALGEPIFFLSICQIVKAFDTHLLFCLPTWEIICCIYYRTSTTFSACESCGVSFKNLNYQRIILWEIKQNIKRNINFCTSFLDSKIYITLHIHISYII